MPRTTHLSALLIAALFPIVNAVAAEAASRTATVSGPSLLIDTPCARHVAITPDPDLHGQVTISATADHQEELDRLVFDQLDGNAALHTVKAGCWRPMLNFSFSPTLELVLRVPAGMALAIDESGAGSYSIGPVGGALDLDLSGAATVEAESVTALKADLSGNGSVAAGQVAGETSIDISGNGDVKIGRAQITALSVDLSGAGNVSLAEGQVGTATLEESGFGTMRIGAEVGDATVDISGAGTVRFNKVTGSLKKDITGAGTVTVEK
jgi:hypothetical protein